MFWHFRVGSKLNNFKNCNTNECELFVTCRTIMCTNLNVIGQKGEITQKSAQYTHGMAR